MEDYHWITLDAENLSKRVKGFYASSPIGEDARFPQRAYLALRYVIRHLLLSPGQTILEREIAQILGMSRTPVREALVRLEMEGWVQIIPRRGFIVTPIRVDDLQSIYEVVEALDSAAGSLAVVQAGNEEFEKLEHLIKQQEEALANRELVAWANLDDEFHNKIINLSNNKRLKMIMDSQCDQLYRARLYTIEHRQVLNQSILEHKAILAAMRARNAEAVAGLLKSHRKRARNEIIRIIRMLTEE